MTAGPTRDDGTASWLGRLVGGMSLLLIIATQRLWTGTARDVPAIPLTAWSPPGWFEGVSLIAVLGGATELLVPRGIARLRRGGLLLALGYLGLFLGDQARMQPWTWQFMLLGWALALVEGREVVAAARWLTISVYLYSAWSKLDAAFPGEIGAWLLSPLMNVFGTRPTWSTPGATWPAWLLPLGELVTGLALAAPRTRAVGVWLSLAMHLTLLGLLGPWGLNHSWGVLGWNAFFLAQNWRLFGTGPRIDPPSAGTSTKASRATGARFETWLWRTIFAAALIAPAGHAWGLVDPWLAWAVYAPPLEKPTLWLNADDVARLPPHQQRFCAAPRWIEDPTWSAGEVEFDLGRWSLETLGVPVHPGPGYRRALAERLQARWAPLPSTIVTWERTSRWSTAWQSRAEP